jgi:Uncharacterized protein conserved in bacteria
MTAPAWMPLYIADYLADTYYLKAREHGAYLLLIMSYWRHGGLPADEGVLAEIARVTPEEWEEVRPILARLFQDGWRHKRIDAELAEACDLWAKRSAAGKVAASVRSSNRQRIDNESMYQSQSQSPKKETPPLVPPSRTETSTNTVPSQASGTAVDKTGYPLEEPTPDGNGNAHKGYPEDFEAIWRDYRSIASPNASKAHAYKAYKKLSRADSDDCWIGVSKYVLWLGEQRKSRPDYPAQHLATFINGRGWEPFGEKS